MVYTGSDQANGLRPFTKGLVAGESSFLPGAPFFIATVRSFSFSFLMGNPLTLQSSISADVVAGQPFFDAGSADVNFFNTSKWMGFSALSAVDPVSGDLVALDLAQVSLTSQSGTDYRFAIAPVPLPGAAVLFGSCVIALRRRLKSPHI